MSGPYEGRDLSNCGVGRLRVAINCGVLSVNGVSYSKIKKIVKILRHAPFRRAYHIYTARWIIEHPREWLASLADYISCS